MSNSTISVTAVPDTSGQLLDITIHYVPGVFAALFGFVETTHTYRVQASAWRGFTYDLRAGQNRRYHFGMLTDAEIKKWANEQQLRQ